ncbi:MAG: hypothetical protein CMJ18_26995, partial [Phycisphaeraceae bacterium]|nr:hypothetical protein [Phycisphaeraceae bacterium]
MTRIVLPHLAAILLCLAAAHPARALELARDGATGYRIVVSADADVSTRAVAEDFAALLNEISGAAFPVVTDATAPTNHEIVVGHDNRRPGVTDTTGMAIGAYEIRTAGATLLIAGTPPRGTINGLYGFLQDHLGCRFLTPGAFRLPRQPTIRLGNIVDRQA